MSRALALVVGLSLALPAFAQSDAPVLLKPTDAPCVAGDIVLKPDEAVKVAKRLATAEAKVTVYEAHPPLPVWAVVLLVGGGMVLGGVGVVAFYEIRSASTRP